MVAVLAALLVALAIHVHNLLQPERFTALLENDLAAVGLKLNMQAPAEPTLFPRPGVKLQGFSLTNVGSQTPVLQAAGATIVVPWRTLLRGDVAIERIDIDTPRLDIDQLESLLARLPRHAGPPRLPTVTAGIQMNGGILTRNGSPLLFDVAVATGALAPGQTFQLDVSARSASGHRFNATLATVPSTAHDGVIDFNPLHLSMGEQQGTTVNLAGRGSWRGGEAFAMHLEGTLQHRMLAATTSAATSAPTDAVATDTLIVDVSPMQGNAPMTVALHLAGSAASADLKLQPTQFADWWKQVWATGTTQHPVPLPFAGKAEVQQLDIGWLQAKGLSIEADPAPAATSGASASAPAASR